MLPMFKTKAIAALTVFSLVIGTAAPSYAWGRREKDTLTGVLGTLLIGGLVYSASRHPQVSPRPQPIYVPPAPVSIYSTPAAASFNAYSDSQQRRIQSTLSAYGYYHSSIDGSFGPATYNATVAYANATGRSNLLGSMAGTTSIYDGLLF